MTFSMRIEYRVTYDLLTFLRYIVIIFRINNFISPLILWIKYVNFYFAVKLQDYTGSINCENTQFWLFNLSKI